MACEHKETEFIQTASVAVVTCKTCGLAASGPTMEIAKGKFEAFSKIKPRQYSCNVSLTVVVGANSEEDASNAAQKLIEEKLKGEEFDNVQVDDVEADE